MVVADDCLILLQEATKAVLWSGRPAAMVAVDGLENGTRADYGGAPSQYGPASSSFPAQVVLVQNTLLANLSLTYLES